MGANEFMLASLTEAIDKGELTIEEVIDRINGQRLAAEQHGAVDASPSGSIYPTLRDHVAAVVAPLSKNSADTWNTHYNRLIHGTAPMCACECDACLDLALGCACGCKYCAKRVAIPALPDLVLRPGAITKTKVATWARVAELMATKRALRFNKGRAERGLDPLPTHGQGGRENFVTALRHLFGALVDDELWTKNPAAKVSKGTRNDTVRRALEDHEIPRYFDLVVSGGDDPELDFMLSWFHLEAGCRQAGAVSLTMGRLKTTTQMIRLHEKARSQAEQPVSAELIGALTAFAIDRGGSRCDRASEDYDSDAPVFYYKKPKDGRPHPLSAKRYETLYRRVQTAETWAGEIRLSSHSLRKTGASIIERIAGSEVARYYLRHGRRTTTQVYTEASMSRLAKAVEVFTDASHPAARSSHSDQ